VKLVPWCLALLAAASSCDFDAAFRRYCEQSGECARDASAGPEASSGPEVSSGPEASSGPEVSSGPETGPGQDSDDGPAGGRIPMPRSCGPNNDCGPEQICHPVGQVCMKTCNSPDDCPQWLDTCIEIRDQNGSVRTPKVCTCSSAVVCSDFGGGNFTCHPTDQLCERYCSSAQDCDKFQPPRVCEKTLGLCESSAPACTSNADCPYAAQPHCDLPSRRCMGCLSSSDCADRPDGLTQCGPNGGCVSPS
jgi:hypothetical protein